MDNKSQASHYELYINHFSICSLQVLYTLALRGEAKDEASEMIVDKHEIDLYHEGQLEEQFLYEINDEGLVRA